MRYKQRNEILFSISCDSLHVLINNSLSLAETADWLLNFLRKGRSKGVLVVLHDHRSIFGLLNM